MTAVRTVAAVTCGRADFGIVRPIAATLAANPLFALRIVAAAAHLSPYHDNTLGDIQAAGLKVDERVDMLLAADTPIAVAKSAGLGVLGFAEAFSRLAPDLALLVGDRYETLSAATAALALGIPIAHVHGGEITEGANDEQYRHAISKMSHLHFVANAAFATRLMAMGEEPWRIEVCGAPGLDTLLGSASMSRSEFCSVAGLPDERPFVLATYQAATLDPDGTMRGLESLLQALVKRKEAVLFTAPNADAGRVAIAARVDAFSRERPDVHLRTSLGGALYANALRHADAMVGNSSSGLLEAPSFGLPVVNVGARQAGRLRAANVVDCDVDSESVEAAVERALAPEFRRRLSNLINPYGDGNAAARIVAALARAHPRLDLLRKRFYEGKA